MIIYFYVNEKYNINGARLNYVSESLIQNFKLFIKDTCVITVNVYYFQHEKRLEI